MRSDKSTKVDTVKVENAAMTADTTDTINLAQSIKNTVQGVYTNTNRAGYRMTNSNSELTMMLKGSKTGTLTDKDGNVYAENTFKTFYTDASGVRHYFENGNTDGRVNTIRMGEYYYDCHIRDFESGLFKVDKNYHIYGDRIYQQYYLYASSDLNFYADFGVEIMISKATVKEYKQTDDYVAFVIKNVGVIGFIGDNISVDSFGTKYIVTQLANEKNGTVPKYDEADYPYITFGSRIYTDSTDNFDGVQKAAYEENNPLEVTVGENNAECEYAGYDKLRGCYTFNCTGTSFNIYYYEPSLIYNMPFTIKGDDTDRNVYVRFFCEYGMLEAAALLDENGTLLPVDSQVSKNFMGDGGEGFYSVKDFQYGDSFAPISVKANADNSYTMLHCYCDWGEFPLKQLSSIEFHTSYYHISTGTTESNCIAPYYADNNGWTLPDFRCASGNIWEGQPQFNSVGILKFVIENDIPAEFSGSVIDSVGKSYIDLTDSYVADSGCYTYSTRHVEFPQRDENRTFYTVKIDFTEDVTYENFSECFDLFSFNGRFNAFEKLGYINENNEAVVVSAKTEGSSVILGTDKPYFGVFDVTEATSAMLDENFGCNFAMIIRDSKIIVDGKETEIPFMVKYSGSDAKTDTVLTLNAETLSFKKGDSIELNIILLPWGTGTETEDTNVRNVRNEGEMVLTAAVGVAENDAIVPAVKTVDNKAEFTVTGGNNNIAVRVDGVTKYSKPYIEKMNEQGEFEEYDVSVHGYDGYSITTAQDGTYSVSFTFATDGSAQTFRFSVD